MLIIFLVLLCRPQSPDHAVHQLTAGMKFPTLLEAMVAAPMMELVSRRSRGSRFLRFLYRCQRTYQRHSE